MKTVTILNTVIRTATSVKDFCQELSGDEPLTFGGNLKKQNIENARLIQYWWFYNIVPIRVVRDETFEVVY